MYHYVKINQINKFPQKGISKSLQQSQKQYYKCNAKSIVSNINMDRFPETKFWQ